MKENLMIKGSNCKGPVAGYVFDVFGVSVAGVDELEEDRRGGEDHVVEQLAGHYGEQGLYPEEMEFLKGGEQRDTTL